MRHFQVLLNYGGYPIGYLRVDDDSLTDADLAKVAIVPAVRHEQGGKLTVEHFGMIQRTKIDTRPREELGE